MALTQLPEEIVEQIAQLLEVRDLLACSAVSLAWREKFNIDAYWKRFCFKDIADILEDTPCDVDPPFIVPQQSDGCLQPLCTWRLHYMRKVHLVNNWKSQRYSSFKIRPLTGVVSSDVHVDCDGVHWLLIRTSSVIEVWNINATPRLYASISIFSGLCDISTFIVGKCVTVSQWNITSVYNLENIGGKLKTAFRFVLEDDKCLSEKFWNTTEKADIFLLNERLGFCYMTFRHLLVGYDELCDSPAEILMHVWDIKTGDKVYCVSMLNSFHKENKVICTNIYKVDETKGLIRHEFCSLENTTYSQLYIYDFKKQDFTSTDILSKAKVMWCGCTKGIIVTCSYQYGRWFVKFYNSSSGELLSTKNIGAYACQEQLQLIDSYFFYCKKKRVYVLDVHNQKVVCYLRIGIISKVRRLTSLSPRFVTVWLNDVRYGYRQQVWDLKDLSSKVFEFSSQRIWFDIATQSTSILKQVVAYKSIIYLYSFW